MFSDIRYGEKEEESAKKKVNLLSEVPCGQEFSHCKFIHDAYVAQTRIPELENKLHVLKNQVGKTKESIEDLNPEQVDEHLIKYQQVLEKKNDFANEIAENELKIEKNTSKQLQIANEIKE